LFLWNDRRPMSMGMEFSIMVAGEAGQGMKTIGRALSEVFVRSGCNIYSNMDYMSRIRGGNNFYQLRVSDVPVYALREKVDLLIALDAKSVSLHESCLGKNGILVLDAAKFDLPKVKENFLDLPLYEMAKETGGSDIYVNSVACGIVVGLTKIGFDVLEDTLENTFRGKDAGVLGSNVEAAKKGYDSSRGKKKSAFPVPEKQERQEAHLINGNEAIALGAIKAGCKFYTAYPMSPSTGIMAVMAKFSERYNIVVEQAEDEIAAVNMAIGGSFAGARSMTATSGGGLALMVEGISLAGMTETPVVIVNAQRPAPATGFPTRTEQGDLNFVLHAGHGEFAKVVYAPGTSEEAFRLTIKAFEVADRFQIPVLILTDQHLADAVRNIDGLDTGDIEIRKRVISREESRKISGYERYKITDSGISPRAVPSWIEDVIYADSDEHTEKGHITEDADIRVKMVRKRLYSKMAKLQEEAEPPVAYNTSKAKMILVGFGSTYGVLFEAVKNLGSEDVGMMHLPQVWPFPSKEVFSTLKDTERVITVENNATGQLAGLIQKETLIRVERSILKYDGRPFNVDLLMNEIKGL
jgi:2-oxoglutarate/2-oxoacid ferredoxin oxidoreductase subunit alpha